MFTVRRSPHNPILQAERHNPWEAYAAFNPSPTKYGKKHLLLYRAMSENVYHEGIHLRLSTIGLAESKDGKHFTKRRQFISPEEDWEKYGCEDPRVTKIDGKYYIFYTALSTFPFSKEGIKIAVAVTKDFKTITERHLVTPFNAKAMTLFPEKIGGKYVAIFSYHTDSGNGGMAFATLNKISDLWSPEYWRKWEEDPRKHYLDLGRKAYDNFEVGASPVKTKSGWLLVYSHIQHYGQNNVNFGIEALLLDLKNPRKIISRTHGPFLTPEETYERFGQVPNVIFPSGATIDGNTLRVYYGGADTSSCRADIELDQFLAYLCMQDRHGFVTRFRGNPLLSPIPEHKWEDLAVYNPAVIDIGGLVNIVYRGQGKDGVSYMGLAESKDGETISKRYSEPIYFPRTPFEQKRVPSGNSGCEDPRLTLIDDKIYMCYTAYTGSGPAQAAITNIKVSDFIKRKWDWAPPTLVTPDGIDDKDACLFPAIVNNQFLFLHRIEGDICADLIADFNKGQKSLANRYQLLESRPGMWDEVRVGIAGPPMLTNAGWLLLYHGVSYTGTYRVGAALFNKKNPTELIARSAVPILEPVEKYEREGMVPRVTFPCGAIIRKGIVYIYYGGADTVVAGAKVPLKALLASLR